MKMLDLARAVAEPDRQRLLDLRLQLARGINPMHAAGSDIQDTIMNTVRRALGS